MLYFIMNNIFFSLFGINNISLVHKNIRDKYFGNYYYKKNKRCYMK